MTATTMSGRHEPRLTDGLVGRVGVGVVGLVWAVGALLGLIDRSHSGTGVARSSIPFFDHPPAVIGLFLLLGALLVIAAFVLSLRGLADLFAAWLLLQTLHATYHLYDIKIIRPADRLPIMGGFVLILLVSAYLLFLLRRQARADHAKSSRQTSSCAPQRPIAARPTRR
jgi:hypothetical protein